MVQLFIFSVSSLILLIISRQHLKNLLLFFSSIIITSEMSFTSVFFLVCDKNSSVAWPECLEIHKLSHILCTNPTWELYWVSLHSNSLCPIICSYFKLFFSCYIAYTVLYNFKSREKSVEMYAYGYYTKCIEDSLSLCNLSEEQPLTKYVLMQ